MSALVHHKVAARMSLLLPAQRHLILPAARKDVLRQALPFMKLSDGQLSIAHGILDFADANPNVLCKIGSCFERRYESRMRSKDYRSPYFDRGGSIILLDGLNDDRSWSAEGFGITIAKDILEIAVNEKMAYGAERRNWSDADPGSIYLVPTNYKCRDEWDRDFITPYMEKKLKQEEERKSELILDCTGVASIFCGSRP